MHTGTLLLVILGAALVATGAVMTARGRGASWWPTIVFGILMLAAAALTSYVTTL